MRGNERGIGIQRDRMKGRREKERDAAPTTVNMAPDAVQAEKKKQNLM